MQEYRAKLARDKGEVLKERKPKKQNHRKISAEDKEFLNEYGNYVGIVSQMDAKALQES